MPGSAPADAVPSTGTTASPPTTYLVGRGISDVTGEAAEVGMMGYSSFEQKASGIHQRQRSRAFVVADRTTGKRVVHVSADLAMIFQSVQQGVIAGLEARYGPLYSEENVLLSATHTHAGPGGHSHHLAYNLASLGFQEDTYRAIVDGIVESVAEAHEDLAPGTITLGKGELTDASVNRSRSAFEENPAADKAAFPGAIDPAMTVLRFRQGDRDIGAISWFATHNTSLTNENTLISPDNKGYAAYEWEHDDQGVRYLENQEGFVAAFPNTNAGDMSPNLHLKPGSGPTEDEFENTRSIGDRQFRTAQEALGMSSPVAKLLEPFNIDPPEWLVSCHYPKANLVPTGLVNAVTPTTPTVLPLQIVKIGQFHLVAGPAEYTVVSGLRIRRTVAQELGVPLRNVLMQGYANAYSQYVTTPEEYDLQQYEGGSTLYGRYTLPAHQQEFASLAASLRDGTTIGRGPSPADHSGRQTSLQTGVVMDNPPPGRKFGDVLTEPAESYGRGATVTAAFVTGHPKNDLRRGGTFLEVQQLVDGRWVRRLDDGDWDTTYRWVRLNGVTGTSKAVVTWKVAPGTPEGTYRLVHFGDSRSLFGRITGFSGATRPFTVG